MTQGATPARRAGSGSIGRFRLKLALALSAALVLAAPAAAQALPRGFFGVVPQTPLRAEDANRMAAGGVETVRMPLSWGSTEAKPGKYYWEAFDATVATAAAQHMEVLPNVYSTPRWLSGDWRRLPVDNARQRRAWSEFLRAAVERYGREGTFWVEHGPGTRDPLPRIPIRAWQIWNEENFFYFTKPASPQRYARLLALSRKAVRQGDRKGEIVLGGLFGQPRQGPPKAMTAIDFLDQLYRVHGVKANFDAVALHPYAVNVPTLRSLVDAVRRTMIRHGDRRGGLYVTEMGWGSQEHSPVAFEVGKQGQARELRGAYRFLISNRHRLNLRQVDWFSWKDLAGSCSFCDSAGLFHAGAGFRPKPAWHAFVSIAR